MPLCESSSSAASSSRLAHFLPPLYYRRKFEQLKSTNALLPQDSFVSSGLLLSMRDWSFLPEALLFLIHAPPFVSFEVSMPYYDLHRSGTYTTTLSTDELAMLFMMFSRAYLIRWIPYVAGSPTTALACMPTCST